MKALKGLVLWPLFWLRPRNPLITSFFKDNSSSRPKHGKPSKELAEHIRSTQRAT